MFSQSQYSGLIFELNNGVKTTISNPILWSSLRPNSLLALDVEGVMISSPISPGSSTNYWEPIGTGIQVIPEITSIKSPSFECSGGASPRINITPNGGLGPSISMGLTSQGGFKVWGVKYNGASINTINTNRDTGFITLGNSTILPDEPLTLVDADGTLILKANKSRVLAPSLYPRESGVESLGSITAGATWKNLALSSNLGDGAPFPSSDAEPIAGEIRSTGVLRLSAAEDTFIDLSSTPRAAPSSDSSSKKTELKQLRVVVAGYEGITFGMAGIRIGQIMLIDSFKNNIIGGIENTCSQSSCVIIGGTKNVISGGTGTNGMSVVVGGAGNKITSSGNLNFIGGGGSSSAGSSSGNYGNAIGGTSSYATVAGGYFNVITSANYSFIGGGSSNVITRPASVICGGIGNLVKGNAHNLAFIGGGTGNIIDMAIINGNSGTANSIVGGSNNNIGETAANNNCIAGGGSNIFAEGNKIMVGNNNFIGAGATNIVNASGGANATLGGVGSAISGVSANSATLGGTGLLINDLSSAAACGQFNDTRSIDGAAPVFMVGGGEDALNRRNLFTITADGVAHADVLRVNSLIINPNIIKRNSVNGSSTKEKEEKKEEKEEEKKEELMKKISSLRIEKINNKYIISSEADYLEIIACLVAIIQNNDLARR